MMTTPLNVKYRNSNYVLNVGYKLQDLRSNIVGLKYIDPEQMHRTMLYREEKEKEKSKKTEDYF